MDGSLKGTVRLNAALAAEQLAPGPGPKRRLLRGA